MKASNRFALVLAFFGALAATTGIGGEVGPPQPLNPCSPKQCSSSRMAGFEAAVDKLRRQHPRNRGLEALAGEIRGKAAPAQNESIRQYFGFDAKMDIEDIEAAVAKRTVDGQDDPLTPQEVALLADLWVGAKE